MVKSMLTFFRPKNISFGTKAVPPATPQGGGGGEVGRLINRQYLLDEIT